MCPHYDFPNVSCLRTTPDDLQKWRGKIPQYPTLHKELKATCRKLTIGEVVFTGKNTHRLVPSAKQ